MLKSLATFCEMLNARIGRITAWLTLLTVLLMFGNVMLRYLFNSGAPWQTEIVLFCHAITFLGLMGYTWQAGEQVRVDVFYTRFSERKKAWVDLLGTLFLLFPLCMALVYFSWGFVGASWELKEASSEYHGMPGVFLLKTFLLIGPALLFLQGISVAVQSWEKIRHG